MRTRFKQLQDPRLSEIAWELEYNDSEKFQLIEGLVYKKDTDHARFVVSETMISNVIKAHHDEMAHCGPEKIYQGIITNYWFPSMRKHVRLHIENCITCLVANSSSNRLESQLQNDSAPRLTFEVLHIDHFDPLQESEDGLKYILVIIDAFTRYV